MMKCAYCIGCKWYRPADEKWCAHDDADKCNNREHYEAKEE